MILNQFINYFPLQELHLKFPWIFNDAHFLVVFPTNLNCCVCVSGCDCVCTRLLLFMFVKNNNFIFYINKKLK